MKETAAAASMAAAAVSVLPYRHGKTDVATQNH